MKWDEVNEHRASARFFLYSLQPTPSPSRGPARDVSLSCQSRVLLTKWGTTVGYGGAGSQCELTIAAKVLALRRELSSC